MKQSKQKAKKSKAQRKRENLRNQEQLRIERCEYLGRYKTTDLLPAELFFKINETGDLRFLLKTKLYPKHVPPDLPSLWDKIKKEWEEHTGDSSASSNLADVDETAMEMNDLNRLKAIYGLMRLGDENMIQELEEIGIEVENISYESLNKVWGMIQIQQTNLEIYIMRYNSMMEFEDKQKEKFNFLQTLNHLSNFFGRNIPRDISTTEFAYLMNDVAEVKAKQKNGRARQFQSGTKRS